LNAAFGSLNLRHGRKQGERILKRPGETPNRLETNMTRLLTSTLVLGASLAAALISAPVYAANATPQAVAVAPSGATNSPTIKNRKSVGTAPEIVITGVRTKPDSQIAGNDERPTKS
jgi:hypothetical protein